MDDLAIAYVTCDKYEKTWMGWYNSFKMNWSLNYPLYFCGEEKECPFEEFTQIPHETVEVDQWTTKLRAQIKQIKAKNIFVLLDDIHFRMDISEEFEDLYSIFKELDADSLRLMARKSTSRADDTRYKVFGEPVRRLKPHTSYLISWSPNIFKKKFLLECLQWDESPWESEIYGTDKIRRLNRKLYIHTIVGWNENTIRHI